MHRTEKCLFGTFERWDGPFRCHFGEYRSVAIIRWIVFSEYHLVDSHPLNSIQWMPASGAQKRQTGGIQQGGRLAHTICNLRLESGAGCTSWWVTSSDYQSKVSLNVESESADFRSEWRVISVCVEFTVRIIHSGCWRTCWKTAFEFRLNLHE